MFIKTKSKSIPKMPESGWSKKQLNSFIDDGSFDKIICRDFPEIFHLSKDGSYIQIKNSEFYLARMNFPTFFHKVNSQSAKFLNFEELLDHPDVPEQVKIDLLFHLDLFK